MKNSGLLKGILLVAVGIFLIYWAQTHSPKNFGQVIGNSLKGSYSLSEPWYYVCLGLGILVGVVGVLRTFKSLK